MISLLSLPSYAHISGFLPEGIESILPEGVEDFAKWLCCHCELPQGVYTVPHFGVNVSKCKRCGHLNVLVNGQPVK